MSKYKLTKIKESEGDKHFYTFECLDEWKGRLLVSWDYEKLEVGEDYIIQVKC